MNEGEGREGPMGTRVSSKELLGNYMFLLQNKKAVLVFFHLSGAEDASEESRRNHVCVCLRNAYLEMAA